MKKIWLSVSILVLGAAWYLFAQDAATTTADDGGSDNVLSDTGTVEIEQVLVDDFEDAGSWQGMMARDLGIIRVQKREGGPADLTEADPDNNQYILGAKVSYFKTGPSWFALAPPREIPVAGISKGLSVWVAGRNFQHHLKAIIRDFNGDLRFTKFGKLNFPGWQKMEAAIPDSVDQYNYRLVSYDRPRGILFHSLVIDCAMDETVGEYYLYLDNLEATSDMFLENPDNQIQDDPKDNW